MGSAASAALWLLLEIHSPETRGARLAPSSRLDKITIEAGDGYILQVVKVESTARVPRSYEEFGRLNDALISSKFVNTLPPSMMFTGGIWRG